MASLAGLLHAAGHHVGGDEHNPAFFDRGPNSLHYRARTFIPGPVEFDHGDLNRDLDAVLTAFRAGTAQISRHGTDDDDPVLCLLPHLRAGDVVIGCSSGSFGGFRRNTLRALGGEHVP